MERLYSQPELDEDEAEEGGGGGRRDNDGSASVFSSATSSRGPVRSDLDSMMDDFLGTYSMAGKKRVRRIGNKTGLEQLDEIVSLFSPSHPSSNHFFRLCPSTDPPPSCPVYHVL